MNLAKILVSKKTPWQPCEHAALRLQLDIEHKINDLPKIEHWVFPKDSKKDIAHHVSKML